MEKSSVLSKLWLIWKYAIGSFSDEKTKDYDNYVAVIRTIVVLINVVCAFFIMGNIIPDDEMHVNSDLNEDGFINIIDIVSVVNIILY